MASGSSAGARTTDGRGDELQRDGQWDHHPHSGYLGVAAGEHPNISPTKQKRLLLNVIQNNSKNQIPIFIFSNKKRKFKKWYNITKGVIVWQIVKYVENH